MISNTEILTHILSLVVIIAYSTRFFNQPLYSYSESNARYKDFVLPVEPRLMTEYHAYKFFRSIFTSLLVVIYVVLFYSLSTIKVDGFGEMAKAAMAVFGEYKVVSSIASVLAIIGVTQYPKWLSALIGDLRSLLHEQARIPIKGHDLFDKLLHIRINYKLPEAQAIIDSVINNNPVSTSEKRRDINAKDFEIENRKDILWKWAKLSYLLHCLEENVVLKRGRRFELEYNLGYRGLQHEYIELLDDIVDYRTNKKSWEQKQIDKLREEVRKLLYQTCRLIACLLILTSDPKVDPAIWLKKHAYEVSVENRRMLKRNSILQSMSVVLLSVIVFTFISSFIYSLFFDMQINITKWKLFSYNIYIIIMMVLPLCYIVYMKQRLSIVGIWPVVLSSDDEMAFKDRQWSVYFGLGFIGWLAVNVISSLFAFAMIKIGLSSGATKEFSDIFKIMWPFTFIAFVVIVMSAYRLDTAPLVVGKYVKPYLRYIVQATLQGGMIAIVIKLGFLINNLTQTTGGVVPLSFYCVLGFVAGFSISLAFQFSNDSYEDAE